jgi:hypothetical protein
LVPDGPKGGFVRQRSEKEGDMSGSNNAQGVSARQNLQDKNIIRHARKLAAAGKLLRVGCVFAGMSALISGCLTREISSEPPATKTNVLLSVRQSPIDKIDILLAVDNSASMGDKQKFLGQAVPRLVNRLVTPRCVDESGKPNGATADLNKESCPSGTPEFRPITDIHIAVVTSSLGGFGGGSQRTDGLLALTPPQDESGGNGFLAWFPNVEKNQGKKAAPGAIKDPGRLAESVQKVVELAGEGGAGLEAQLESVYRFLIQPDPWASVENGGVLKGVENRVLKQRKEFLRNDSLVAIIMLTDEDDSSVDPASVFGAGWKFMASDSALASVYPKDWPDESLRGKPIPLIGRDSKQGSGSTRGRGTTACDSTPNDEACQWCELQYAENCGGVLKPGACERLRNDANCKDDGGFYGAKDESLNIRFHLMKKRFGVDPQYPLRRYVNGLTQKTVPMRGGEHANDLSYIVSTDQADPATICTNPLFAKELPTSAEIDEAGVTNVTEVRKVRPKNSDAWCNLQVGEREAGSVFFAVIGGAPPELVYGPEKDGVRQLLDDDGNARPLNDAEWNKITGKDPVNYDYRDQDPRMIQSRAKRRDGSGNTLPADWNTDSSPFTDLQYACTFDLPDAFQRVSRDPTIAIDDCSRGVESPLCAAGDVNTNRRQIKGKAFPTIREFTLARLLGEQGIAASLCAENVTDPSKDNYGYNPAVSGIVDRLKNALSAQCLPRRLNVNPVDNRVQCLVLETMPEDFQKTCADIGRATPDPTVLARFREQKALQQGCGGSGQKACAEGQDLTKRTVCQLKDVPVPEGESCVDNADPVWCYVTRAAGKGKNPAGRCSQGIIFSRRAVSDAKGALVDLQCIDQTTFGATK